MESRDILKVKAQLKDPTKMFETCWLLGCPTTTRKPDLKDYGLFKARKTELCIQASRQALYVRMYVCTYVYAVNKVPTITETFY